MLPSYGDKGAAFIAGKVGIDAKKNRGTIEKITDKIRETIEKVTGYVHLANLKLYLLFPPLHHILLYMHRMHCLHYGS